MARVSAAEVVGKQHPAGESSELKEVKASLAQLQQQIKRQRPKAPADPGSRSREEEKGERTPEEKAKRKDERKARRKRQSDDAKAGRALRQGAPSGDEGDDE